MTNESIHFVTGRLAEHSLRSILSELAAHVDFDYTVDVLPITVAALMTPEWIARHIHAPADTTRVLIPGYCDGDLAVIQGAVKVNVERGPRDLQQLPEWFGHGTSVGPDYGQYDIEILAEVNHAPRLKLPEILAQARSLRKDGANVIDVGCDPGPAWPGVAECVRALCDEGFRVSIDSFNPAEIEPAVRAGAELVLSVNSTNRQAALDWGCEVVVVPDDFASVGAMEETIEMLTSAGVSLRIDPVLEPIGLGMTSSLHRYQQVRCRWPDAEMMMGIGNLTELTDVDSAGVNVLLLAICQELGIRSVLTTQVINWARGSVRECDRARRLVHYAVRNKVIPKHLEPGLVMLRDTKLYEQGPEQLARLAEQVRDNNYRLFAEDGQLHLIGANLHLQDTDPFLLFERLTENCPKNVDASHAFYLGFELCKAVTALTLGKQYRQDEELNWGMLTVPESSHRLRKSTKHRPPTDQS